MNHEMLTGQISVKIPGQFSVKINKDGTERGSNQRINVSPPKTSINILLQVGHAIPRNPATLPNPTCVAEYMGRRTPANVPVNAEITMSVGNSHSPTGVMRVKSGLTQSAEMVPIERNKANATVSACIFKRNEMLGITSNASSFASRV